MKFPIPFQPKTSQALLVYTDGSIRPRQGCSGLGAVVRDANGRVQYCWQRQAPAMTNNAAEYAAVIFALQQLQKQGVKHIHVFTDSRLIVEQVQGQAATKSAHLREISQQLRLLVTAFSQVQFHHIPREQNRLADALANEAADGGFTCPTF